jgi:hypothetical protein
MAWAVIGVAPPGRSRCLKPEPLWLPLSMHAQFFSGPLERLYNERRFRFLNTFAKLKAGVTEKQPERGPEFMRAAVAKVRTVPGVVSVSIADSRPLGVGLLQTAFREGDPVDSRLGFLAPTPPVSPDYFETLRVPLVEGPVLN